VLTAEAPRRFPVSDREHIHAIPPGLVMVSHRATRGDGVDCRRTLITISCEVLMRDQCFSSLLGFGKQKNRGARLD
jgi:hypothetical protein